MEEIHRDLGFIAHPKLIELACLLIKYDVVKLEDVYSYLGPQDSVLERIQAQRLENGKQKVMKSFKMILEEIDDVQRIKLKDEDNLKFAGQLLYSSKLALMTCMVRVNDWKNFWILWEHYKYKIDLLLYQPLLIALMDMIDWIIEPLYSKISTSRFFKKPYTSKNQFPLDPSLDNSNGLVQITQCHDLYSDKFVNLSLVLGIVNQYIGFKSKLFIKLCRLFRSIVKNPNLYSEANGNSMSEESLANFADHEIVKHKIMEFTKEYIVPGISYQNENPALSNEAFQLLETFDYRFRYSCYL